MQKDYYDMTDREKLIYVLEDIGAGIIYSSVSGGTIIMLTDYNCDMQIEFRFNAEGDFANVVAY